jgi:hypothetical protein
MFVLAMIAAAALAADAPKAPEMVQLKKTMCMASRNSTDVVSPTCQASESRIAGPYNCFCPGGYLQVDVPACWRDGSPALKRKGARPSNSEFDKMIACEQVSNETAHSRPAAPQ